MRRHGSEMEKIWSHQFCTFPFFALFNVASGYNIFLTFWRQIVYQISLAIKLGNNLLTMSLFFDKLVSYITAGRLRG